jgi:hypothetical protein
VSAVASEVSRLRALLRYEPETGEIFWRADRANKKAGDRAGRIGKNGYADVCVDYKRHYVHRIAIAFETGEFPTKGMHVDHINGDPLDNRLSNLRVVTVEQNIFHRTKTNRNNTSGVRGVYRSPKNGRFVAFIHENTKKRHIGVFDTLEAASAAREAENVARMR